MKRLYWVEGPSHEPLMMSEEEGREVRRYSDPVLAAEAYVSVCRQKLSVAEDALNQVQRLHLKIVNAATHGDPR